MTIESLGAIIAILISIASFATAIVRGRAERKKLEAEASQIIGESWDKLVEKLNSRIAQLEQDIEKRVLASCENENEINKLRRIIDGQENRLAIQEQRLITQEAEIQALTKELLLKKGDLEKSNKRITELEDEVVRLKAQLEQVKKKTGPLNGDNLTPSIP